MDVGRTGVLSGAGLGGDSGPRTDSGLGILARPPVDCWTLPVRRVHPGLDGRLLKTPLLALGTSHELDVCDIVARVLIDFEVYLFVLLGQKLIASILLLLTEVTVVDFEYSF